MFAFVICVRVVSNIYTYIYIHLLKIKLDEKSFNSNQYFSFTLFVHNVHILGSVWING